MGLIRDKVAFVVFILSAAAMDSQDILIPMIACICSLLYLKRRAREYGK